MSTKSKASTKATKSVIAQADKLADRNDPLYLDRERGPDGKLYLIVDYEVDPPAIRLESWHRSETGVSSRVWHGQERNYLIPEGTDIDALASYLEGEGAELIAQVAAGHTVEWNGSNHVGRLTDEASQADDDLQDGLENLMYSSNEGGWIDLEDWLFWTEAELRDEVRGMTDDQIKAKAAELKKSAESDGYLLDGDIETCLRDLRDEEEDK